MNLLRVILSAKEKMFLRIIIKKRMMNSGNEAVFVVK